MSPRQTTAALTIAAIAAWAAAALTATYTSPPEAPPLSRPNMTVLVLTSSLLLALMTSCLVRNRQTKPPAVRATETDGPRMDLKEFMYILFTVAAMFNLLFVIIAPGGPDPATTHWLASVYAAAALSLHLSARHALRDIPRPKEATH